VRKCGLTKERDIVVPTGLLLPYDRDNWNALLLLSARHWKRASSCLIRHRAKSQRDICNATALDMRDVIGLYIAAVVCVLILMIDANDLLRVVMFIVITMYTD
jgi:hypothetical protein